MQGLQLVYVPWSPPWWLMLLPGGGTTKTEQMSHVHYWVLGQCRAGKMVSSHETWMENSRRSWLNALLHNKSLNETEAALRAQLQRSLASSQDPESPQRAFARSPKILRDMKVTEWVMKPHVGNLLGDRSSVRLDRAVSVEQNLCCQDFRNGKWLFRLCATFMPSPDFSPLDFLSISGNAARLKTLCLQSSLASLSVSFPQIA